MASELRRNETLAQKAVNCDSSCATTSLQGNAHVKKRKKTKLGKDKRRKHHHWMVTVYYEDGEKFGRVYIDRGKAARFAERQKRSPVVNTARVTQIS